MGKKSLRPGWTPSQNQRQDQGIRGPAKNPHQLLNACVLSANTTASPEPSTSPTCSRMRQVGCCAPSFETTCVLSVVPLVIAPTPAASARSPAKATPLSTATPPATPLARGWPGLTRRGHRTPVTAEEEQEEPVQVPKVRGNRLDLRLRPAARPLPSRRQLRGGGGAAFSRAWGP